MGKPSITRLSEKKTITADSNSKPSSTTASSKSDESISNKKSTRSKSMSAMKTHTKNKRKMRKTNKKIKKLFQQLRNESNTSLFNPEDNIDQLCGNNNISLNTSNDNSVILLENSQQTGKRKQTDIIMNTCKKRKISTIVINDDADGAVAQRNSSCYTPRQIINPKNCSTPIPKISATVVQDEDCNLTKEINRDSYLTIDLTTDTTKDNTDLNAVIDLENTTDNQDCTFVTASNASLSVSGDSDVTVLENKGNSRNKTKMFNLASGIANLDASDKGRLLEIITKSIFSGCNVPKKVKSLLHVKDSENQATETVEDTYIKEVILGQSTSRNSIGSNIYNPMRDAKNKTGLRMIIIDGSNVAMEYNKGREFSVKALKICIDYFLKRGHVVRAFVPRFRCKFGMSSDPRLLDDLERDGLVVYTPSREIQGRRIASYDDRYIVQCAAEFDGVIVSGDNYRDLHRENPRWRFVIENRVLPFTWVNDMIMFPRDPLGWNGPTLEEFLRHPPVTTSIEIS
ncbi:MATH and LRR domain-containing protein PFE0570w-like [Achroia grisella]|uniref:MATH and LRR domain-containing protein PFE0570w-like n=1 Tax=Achroia grisella TaxID=688607 RepID=UPI0027D2814D|nr:MATH and LRR domain-containing protein PFE0570w-like [Achroia grisella]